MVEFEHAALSAALAVRVDIGALQAIPLEHFSLGGVGHPVRLRGTGALWSRGVAESLPLECGDQKIERLVHNRRKVAAWISVCHEIRRELELVPQRLLLLLFKAG